MKSTASKLREDLLFLKRKKEKRNDKQNENRWIVRPKPKKNAKMRIFCLPYAGGSPSVFRTWPMEYDDLDVEICMIQLPGREERMLEPMPGNFYLMVQELGKAILPFLDRPYLIYGHCMGSLISFELLQHLRAQDKPLPMHFLIGAHFAPMLLSADNLTTSHLKALTMDEFFQLAEELGGTEGAVLKDPATSALVITSLKGDYWLYADYEYRKEKPFDFPLTVYAGKGDYLVKRNEVDGWAVETSKSCKIEDVEGDHFFVIKEKETFLPQLKKELNKIITENMD